MRDTKDILPSSQQGSEDPEGQNQANSENKPLISSSEGLHGPAGDELVPAGTESLDTWDHIEPVDEVISASDSEGREAYATLSSGASPNGSRAFKMPTKATLANPAGANKSEKVPSVIKEQKIEDADETQPTAPSDTLGKGVKTPSGASPSSKRALPRKEKQVGQLGQSSGPVAVPPGESVRVQNSSSKPGLTETLTDEEQSGRQGSSQLEPTTIQSPSGQADAGRDYGAEDKGDSGASQDSYIKAMKLEEPPKGDSSGNAPDQNQGAWGWKSWTKLTEQLKEAASGAARDVQELTTSFQQVRHLPSASCASLIC